MRLAKVSIRNFRSIADLTLSFNPTCRILVGINETGKTNILEALALLDPDTTPEPTDIREPGPGESPNDPSFARFIFTLDNSDRDKVYEATAKRLATTDLARPIVQLRQSPLSLRQFCDTYAEALYQVDIRSGARHPMVWQQPPDTKLLPGWKKPSASVPADFTLPIRKGVVVALAQTSLVFKEDFPDLPEEYLEEADPGSLVTVLSEAVRSLVSTNLPDCLLWSYDEKNLLPGQVR